MVILILNGRSFLNYSRILIYLENVNKYGVAKFEVGLLVESLFWGEESEQLPK